MRNLTQKTHWRIKTHIAISHLDVNKINVRVNISLSLAPVYLRFFSLYVVQQELGFNVQYIVADMRKVLSKNPQVEQQRLHRRIFLDNINPENQALMVCLGSLSSVSYLNNLLRIEGIFYFLLFFSFGIVTNSS